MFSWILLSTPVPRRRKAWALLIAIGVDTLRLILLPWFVAGIVSPYDDLLDMATATALLVVLDFRWRLLAGLLIELIPLVESFPTWTAMVLSVPTQRPEPAVAAKPGAPAAIWNAGRQPPP